MTTTLIAKARSDRAALCAAWGYPTPHLARYALQQGAEDLNKAPKTPALSFDSRETYLAARAAWRARHKEMEATIRALKAARRKGGWSEQAEAQSEAYAWAMTAQAALIERDLQKRLAARQWQEKTDAAKAA